MKAFKIIALVILLAIAAWIFWGVVIAPSEALSHAHDTEQEAYAACGTDRIVFDQAKVKAEMAIGKLPWEKQQKEDVAFSNGLILRGCSVW